MPIRLSDKIAGVLREEIRASSMQTGDQLATVVELAARFGVSTVPVNQALARLRFEGVIASRQGSGSYVLDPNGGRHVAVVLGHDIANPTTSHYHLRSCQIIRRMLTSQGIDNRLYVHCPDGDGDDAPWDRQFICPELDRAFKEDRISAMAVAVCPRKSLRTDCALRGIPYVPGAYRTYWGPDDASARAFFRESLGRLKHHGATRVAFLGWRELEYASLHARLFHEAAAAARLETREAWTRVTIPPSAQGAGWQGVFDVWRAAVDTPDGLLIGDDMLLRDAAIAISRLKIRVPDDLVVASHANTGSGIRTPFPIILGEVDPRDRAMRMAEQVARAVRGQPYDSDIDKQPCHYTWLEHGFAGAADLEQQEFADGDRLTIAGDYGERAIMRNEKGRCK